MFRNKLSRRGERAKEWWGEMGKWGRDGKL
jgi:hypothetical protein